MNVADSSGWIEYFADEENADFFAEPIEQTGELVVPTITLYEVFKHVLREEGRAEAKTHNSPLPLTSCVADFCYVVAPSDGWRLREALTPEMPAHVNSQLCLPKTSQHETRLAKSGACAARSLPVPAHVLPVREALKLHLRS